MNDDQLHHLLRKTPAQIQLPDSFGREVWSRIEAGESMTVGACLSRIAHSLFALLARPLPATLTITTFIALGALMGGLDHRKGTKTDEMQYVESIHPLMQSMEDRMP